MEMNMILLASVVVGECFCTMEMFWENVGNEKQTVIQAVNNTQDLNTIRQLVNKYI